MKRTDHIAAAAAFELRLPLRMNNHLAGDRLGPDVGSSLEFQDYRSYTPGDDLRHVDWAAYARRDELVIRLHKEEIAAGLDIILDVSTSMASSEQKRARAVELTRLLIQLGQTDHLRTTLWCVGDGLTQLRGELDEHVQGLPFNTKSGLESLAEHSPQFHRHGLRVVISDLLLQGEPKTILQSIQRNAALCTLVQVLDADEISPSASGGQRLTDVETGKTLDIILNETTITAYKKRLLALTEGYSKQVQTTGGRLIRVTSEQSLLDVCRGPLLNGGLLVPRCGANA